MKKLKFLGVAALALALGVGTMAFAGCGGDDGELDKVGPAGAKSYTFEAEGIDFTGLTSFGYSENISETGMIKGKNVQLDANVQNSLSNGYFVSYFSTRSESGLTLKFPIKADVASTGNRISLRLGTEYGTMTISPKEMDVIVNGTALQYSPITVVGENLTSVTQYKGYKVPFADYLLSPEFDLKAGDNTVEIKIKINTLGFADEPMLTSVGPGVDCIKIKSTSTLTWESLWEANKIEAGLE